MSVEDQRLRRRRVGWMSPARVLTAATGAAAVVTVATMVSVASAAPPHSTLVSTPSTVTFDISSATVQNVAVGLDSGCQNVFVKGQTYSITANSENTSVATVNPPASGALNCNFNGTNPTATFTISTYSYSSDPTKACNAVAGSPTAVDFTPVAGPYGIQKQLSGAQVAVTVTDTTNLCGGDQNPGGGGGGDIRPAAPAVANGYLNASPAAYDACKATFSPSAGKGWRGATISAIAAWMPKPESVKEDTTIFPDASDWVAYVRSEVDHLCQVPGEPDSFDPAPYEPPLVAYSGT